MFSADDFSGCTTILIYLVAKISNFLLLYRFYYIFKNTTFSFVSKIGSGCNVYQVNFHSLLEVIQISSYY